MKFECMQKHAVPMSLLLNGGSNARGNDGKSVLDLACMNGDSQIVRRLVQSGGAHPLGGGTPVGDKTSLDYVIEYSSSKKIVNTVNCLHILLHDLITRSTTHEDEDDKRLECDVWIRRSMYDLIDKMKKEEEDSSEIIDYIVKEYILNDETRPIICFSYIDGGRTVLQEAAIERDVELFRSLVYVTTRFDFDLFLKMIRMRTEDGGGSRGSNVLHLLFGAISTTMKTTTVKMFIHLLMEIPSDDQRSRIEMEMIEMMCETNEEGSSPLHELGSWFAPSRSTSADEIYVVNTVLMILLGKHTFRSTSVALSVENKEGQTFVRLVKGALLLRGEDDGSMLLSMQLDNVEKAVYSRLR